MSIDGATILLTGAAGGIGSTTARELGRHGAHLLLTDVAHEPLAALASELEAAGVDADFTPADLADHRDRARLVAHADARRVDTLINVAGMNPFGLFVEQSAEELERVFLINTTVPVLLCREMLPVLMARDAAHIVNVGSAFGAIGFPGFAAYSASKFAIRGFSEALRRELADTNVGIHYVSPRATATRLITDRIRRMNEALGVAMDPPEIVAKAIAAALRDERRELALGIPERFFAKVNALFPALVDRALRKKLATITAFASPTPAPAHETPPQRSTLTPLQERTQ